MTTNEPDWTAHDGRSNSSPEFHATTAVIEDIIRSSAHTLISGRADAVAGTILATLAHRHGLRPGVAATEPPTDLRDAIAAAIERHEVVWVDHDTGWECGCNEHGDCALMPTRADAVHHIADAVLPAVQAHVAAEVERARGGLTANQRVHREMVARRIITATVADLPDLPADHIASLVTRELRAHGLFDHTCDDLCGTEDDDHHACHEAGYDCSAGGCECMCHGYTNDEEPAVVDGGEQRG